MKSSILVLASLCTVFANEAAKPMRKRTTQMTQHKSSSSGNNARVLTTEEYDPYLGIGMRQLPGAEEDLATGEPPMSMAATEPEAGGGTDAAPGDKASPGGADAGAPEDGPGGAGKTEAMSMSMPTEAEAGDQGFLDKVGDKFKDLTGQSG